MEHMRIRASIQIVESYFMGGAIHIHYHLFQEIRIIVFCIHIQRFAEYRDISRDAGTVIPRFFHIQVLCYFHLTTAGKQVVVFRQHMIGTVPFSGRKTEIHIIIRIVLKMRTRSHEETMFVTVITTQTGHYHPFIIQIQRILHVSTGNSFLFKGFERIVRCIFQTVMLVISVIIEAQSSGETILRIKFRFKHQRSIDVGLIHIIQFASIRSILIV